MSTPAARHRSAALAKSPITRRMSAAVISRGTVPGSIMVDGIADGAMGWRWWVATEAWRPPWLSSMASLAP